ncbi:MAG TPA: AbrB/MazE/SpoVT family DNA-binding domain-containing protein [Ktedonobacterales bacterium]|jgi:antitoxin component of MazEF toxin-antitoxin module
MLTQRVRRVGNSFVVTIPKDEAQRLQLEEGDLVSVEVRKLLLQPEMPPDVRSAFERAMTQFASDLEYLKDR